MASFEIGETHDERNALPRCSDNYPGNQIYTADARYLGPKEA